MKQEYEYEIWQGHVCQAGGFTETPESAIAEADHYAMMYGQDGPVEVRFYVRQEVTRAELEARQAVFDQKLQDGIPAWVITHIAEVSSWMKTRGHKQWSIGGVGPVALNDAQCDQIISRLDEYAREKCPYEYGLPMFHNDAMSAMREIVRAAASA